MNIKKIKEIVDSEISDKIKQTKIIQELAEDENVSELLIKILDEERKFKKGLIQDMNLELSRAHIYIEDIVKNKRIKKESKTFTSKYVLERIANLYYNYNQTISHCFNRFN